MLDTVQRLEGSQPLRAVDYWRLAKMFLWGLFLWICAAGAVLWALKALLDEGEPLIFFGLVGCFWLASYLRNFGEAHLGAMKENAAALRLIAQAFEKSRPGEEDE